MIPLLISFAGSHRRVVFPFPLLMAFFGFCILTFLGALPLLALPVANETVPPILTLQTVGPGEIQAEPPTTTVYYPGQAVTLTAKPAFGFTFDSWRDDLSGAVNPATIVMNGNHSVTATFVAQPPSTIESDDFNQCTLADRWTFSDPVGDATLVTTGQEVEIHVPEGISHDIWSTGNQAPRLTQAANDVDFVIESEFTSVVARRLQMQGLLAMRDEGNLVRVNVQADGRSTRLVAATFVDGVPTLRASEVISDALPIFLRLKRASDEWHITYSYDGANWLTTGALAFSHAMTVTQVGLFAGNSGGNPSFTGKFDYFFNSAAPIVPEDPVPNSIPIHVVGEGTVQKGCGNPLTLEGVPGPGWNFVDWRGSINTTANPVTFAITGQETVTATFAPKPYELRLNIIGGGQVTSTPNQQYFDLHDQVRLNAVADPGWIFTGWSGDIQSSHLAVTLTVTDNLAVNANFAVLADNSGFLSDDFNRCELGQQWQFTDPQNDATLYLSGDALYLSVPAGSEHNIWTTGNYAPHLMQPIVDSDFELEAMFLSPLEKRFQLQGMLVEADEENFVRINFQSDGSSVSLLAVTFVNGNPTVRVNQPINSSGPLALRVVRSGTAWSLLYAGEDRQWITGDEFTFDFYLTAETAGLFAGNAGGAPAHTAIVDYFFATSTPVVPEDGHPILLETHVVGQGSIQPNPLQEHYACGQPVEILAVAEPGWQFQGWSGALGGVNNPNTLTLFATKAVTATFSEAAYSLAVTSEGFGLITVEPEKATYRYGDQVVLTAVTGSGWHLGAWSGDVMGSSPTLTITMDSDKRLHATFVRTEYSLTVDQEGEGEVAVSPKKALYFEGETVLLNANPAAGWEFGGWSGAFSGSSQSTTLFMDQNKAITAHFKRPVSLTTSVQGNGSIVREPVQSSYYQGDRVQLTAVADSGWTFFGWSGMLTGAENPTILLLDDNKTVVAHFVEATVDLQLQVQDQNGAFSGGTVTQSPQGPYKAGQTVTLNALPAPGYRFERWEVINGAPLATDALVQPKLLLTLEETTALIAHFRLTSTAREVFLPIVVR